MNSKDSLIVESLINAGCPLDENVGLNDFSSELVFCSGYKMAKTIENFGYNASDIGYQTFLHKDASTSKDLGLIFQFLIEKLPFKASSSFMQESIQSDKSHSANKYEQKTSSSSKIYHFNKTNPEFYHYRNSNLLEPLKAILSDEAYLSLNQQLYNNRRQYLASSLKLMSEKKYATDNDSFVDCQKLVSHLDEESKEVINNLQNREDVLEHELKISSERLEELKFEINKLLLDLKDIQTSNKGMEDLIIDCENNIATLKKVHQILSDESSIVKLGELIEKRRNKRKVLQKQWEEGAKPVEAEHESLTTKLRDLKSEEDSLSITFNSINTKIQEMEESIERKKVILSSQTDYYNQMKKGKPRSIYTDKLIDLTSKIDGRSSEIKVEMENIKLLYKDINLLSSQLERTFAETDSKIFQVAREDINMISGYKILQKWYTKCNEAMEDIKSVGKIQRDIQDLEKKIEREKARDFAGKIERVKKDISIISRENVTLTI
ncbi:CCDC22 [Lepeophtheirus salmonis]|uniref:Coiled-coil domain-containing protein 22 homolog n=1 Tax=Lepeophtheirus salmonis TaxID=72036 RepID=A0A7R8CL61_LEPSM|nr:CCDC22 [Lepeophtheirus salmonis]CAF2852736.1 CCDC22 [Lepeophtheirus salmonis]